MKGEWEYIKTRSNLEIPYSRISNPKHIRCVAFRNSKGYETTVGAHLRRLNNL
jgi:hypothetical protein